MGTSQRGAAAARVMSIAAVQYGATPAIVATAATMTMIVRTARCIRTRILVQSRRIYCRSCPLVV
jgi:hypothetical protein